MREYFSAEFIKFFLPLIGAVIAWFWNERRRRSWEEYLRKEDRYRELLKSLSGFYIHSADAEARSRFIEEYKKCWMYCDDDVIKAANSAIFAMQKGVTISMEERRKIIGGFVLAIRRDLLRRTLVRKTNLGPEDYKHVSPGN